MRRITSQNRQDFQTPSGRSAVAAKSTVSLALTFVISVCVLPIIGLPSSVHAVGLGNLDVRSYLGEPLNLRIGVITQQNEEIETGCFAVINAPGSEANVNRRDVRLTLVETRNSRYLEVRGANAFNEPIGRLSIRAGCQADSGVVRDYPLLLDPAPLLQPAQVRADAVTNSTPLPMPAPAPASASAPVPVQSSVANAGSDGNAARWTVYEGDTLTSLASGIHPGSRARQSQYIIALRSLNPGLAGIANNAPLPANSQLVLPDLKTLSAGTARTSAATSKTVERETNRAAKLRERTRREPRVAASSVRANAASPTAAVRSSTSVGEQAKATTADVAPKAIEPKKAAVSDGFRLRISGSEMDLSRSQGITDETRAQLRERFAALDADDQTAQLLALKNTVKQIEKRLNEMQLKMATLPASGTVGAAPLETAGAVVLPTVTPTPPAIEKTPPEVVAAAKPIPTPAPPKALEPVKPDVQNVASGDLTTLIAFALTVFAVAALAWWALKRRAAKSSVESQQANGKNSSSDEFNTWVNDPDTELPAESNTPKTVRVSNSARTIGKSATVRDESGLAKSDAATSTRRFAANGAERSAASNEINLDLAPQPVAGAQPTETGADPHTRSRAAANAALATTNRARVETKPITPSDVVKATDTFDLDLDLDQRANYTSSTGDQTSEDRLRRLRYMHERYPELAARTVSIDEPESVIHAARLYYNDHQLGKACELLIYAVEERPQEIRFWLAQFELFRLEKMAPQFTDLALKFELLFSADKSWRKVQQVGLGLDPLHPLFSSGANVADQFDATAENWLDAPLSGDAVTQNISEALIADLRASLFAEHRVTPADFERGPTLLSTMGERGHG